MEVGDPTALLDGRPHSLAGAGDQHTQYKRCLTLQQRSLFAARAAPCTTSKRKGEKQEKAGRLEALPQAGLTVLPRPQPAAWQLEERAAHLHQQHVRVVVLVHDEHAVHAAPHTLVLVPARLRRTLQREWIRLPRLARHRKPTRFKQLDPGGLFCGQQRPFGLHAGHL